ncbi:MAG: 30S ribosomal protein S17 [Nitrospirae bacterium GWC2_57_13]|jgi:small subunit ribosomal protein S17|nr:MAG: 30S ribosomal protein S17 [Nitrospirae bacterium GWC1_57_7]OGW28832.1 MAG: 30S ribosomal protein S17 [Nitrospirae bacterium GWC2_57_13]OGW44618.1 MAG: 30S ribosomal protein S17 [Nitrospirae bacterium GWD2_57_8]HAS55538.1 30S ribosomal protein S17 [Nitrospiraceae bacterium]
MGEHKKRKSYTGRVVSDKMNKTVVLTVTRKISHPRYNKIVKRTTRFKAHDEKNECKIGDLVRFIETRPLSKDKRWIVLEILEKSRTARLDESAGASRGAEKP